MKYIIDNDLHIHSKISACSNDPEQTAERLLSYAKDNGLKTICVADHLWDDAVEGASGWYKPQNYEHISQILPLPKSDDVRFLFGCETELDKNLTLGLSSEKFDLFDFIIIPTTHFHMTGFTMSDEDSANASSRAKAWIRRLDAVLNMDLPFHKVGIAHLTCGLIAPQRQEFLDTLNLIPDDELKRLFAKAAKLGVGIEINAAGFGFPEEETDTIIRIFKTAKECGCKFYFGSDAHHPAAFETTLERLNRAVDLLNLTENDRFVI